MMSRALVRHDLRPDGFYYAADDAAGPFLDNMRSAYIVALRDRAAWVATTFNSASAEELAASAKRLFAAWTIEFQPVQRGTQIELL